MSTIVERAPVVVTANEWTVAKIPVAKVMLMETCTCPWWCFGKHRKDCRIKRLFLIEER